MTEGRRLHEAHIEGRGIDPAGVYSLETLTPGEGVRVLVMSGELDMAAAPEVRAHVDAAADGRALVIDLTDVAFVDSSMLKELLRAADELDRYGAQLVLAAVPPAVQRLLDLTRTARMFTIAPDRETAVALASRSS